MGVDYLARKAAKKGRKKMNENLKPRRERKKKQARRLCRGLCFQEPGLLPEDVQEGGSGSRHSKSVEAAAELAARLKQRRLMEEQAAAAEAAAAAAAEAAAAKETGLKDGKKAGREKKQGRGEEGGGGGGSGGSGKQKEQQRRQGRAAVADGKQQAGAGAGKERKKKRPALAAAASAGAGAGAGEEGEEEAWAAAGTAGAGAAKRLKLSTSVNLLDAKTARREAPRQAQQAQQGRQAGGGSGKGKGEGASGSEGGGALAGQPELIRRFMEGEGLAEPMPVQQRCWPVVLAGRDVEVVAEPGAGKTLGYLLPSAELLVRSGHDSGTQPARPLLLVVLPTRELAQQVASVCRDLRKYSGLRAACLTGGTERAEQVATLASRHPHIVVATPGRLLDLAEGGELDLGGVSLVVLDEADKMLGMGFQPQIQRLRMLLMAPMATGGAAAGDGAGKGDKQAAKKAKKRKGEGEKEGGARRPQVCLFTATMPESVADVASEWLTNPERIRISHSAASISRTVTQVVQVCAEHKKPAKLAKHLGAIKAAVAGLRNPPRVLIFANRIKTVRFLAKLVGEDGYRCAMLHGDRSQEEREQAMHDFRSGKVQVLVATDVAARGLHIRGLPYVVNYDFPPNLETYIHRAGRTGRLAADGHAFSFFTRELAPLAAPLMGLLREHEQVVDPNLMKLAEAYATAAERLGLIAEATGEAAPARPATDDVLRTLGLKTKQQRKNKKKQQQQEEEEESEEGSGEGEEDGSDSEGEGGSSGEEEEEQQRQQRGRQQAQQAAKRQRPAAAPAAALANAAPAAAADNDADLGGEERPFFIPSKTFKGARPGYAFKKGMKGVGYYLDALQQQQQQGKGKGAGRGEGKAAKARHRQHLKEKYTKAPIGGAEAAGTAGAHSGRRKAAAAAATAAAGGEGAGAEGSSDRKAGKGSSKGSSKGSGEASAAKGGQGKKAAPAKPAALLPGQLWSAKGSSGYDSLDDSDGEPGGGSGSGAAAGGAKRKRALPGRIRKKLAAQRQK